MSNTAKVTAARGPHVPELDGVRGIAIVMVMALHFICSAITRPESRLEYLLGRITGYGSWGVDLFFVLSGFLITGILWDTRGRPSYFKTFYIRRTLRIFPLYYATLLVFVFVLPSLVGEQAPGVLRVRELQWWLWPYLANVYIAKQGSFAIPYISHFWTLAVEEHFYLVWPFVVGLLSRAAVLGVSLFAIVVAVALRCAFEVLVPHSLHGHVLTPFRLDALCIGALLALLVRGPLGLARVAELCKRGVVVAALGVLLTSIVHATRPGELPAQALRETFLAVFFGCGIVLASWAEGPTWLKASLRHSWLRFFGKYSYGLYVFHGIIAYALGEHGTLRHFERFTGGHLSGLLLQAAVASLVSIGLAVLSFDLFEERFLRLKDRFEPKLSRKASPSASV